MEIMSLIIIHWGKKLFIRTLDHTVFFVNLLETESDEDDDSAETFTEHLLRASFSTWYPFTLFHIIFT